MRQRATVAIVGRPNVGKSTLFNRLLGRREAVVHDSSGVTRDRHAGVATWCEEHFNLVDTGGLLPSNSSRTEIESLVRESALVAIQEADLLLVILDVNVGITDLDQEIATEVRKSGKPVILVANKADNEVLEQLAHELHRLGLGTPRPTSAVHGLGCADLLDEVLKQIAEVHTDIPESDAELSIAIIGKPNVGKSSLLNAILGEQRVLVSAVPGTTRDSIDTNLQWHGHSVDIIDTAGLRKRGRIQRGVEAFSVLRTMESIERSDVCLLVLDASLPISAQDTHIAGHAHKTSRGIVTLFNKWDLVSQKETKTAKRYAQDFREAFSFIRYAPVEYLSALTHQRIHRVLEAAWKVHQSRDQKIPTSQLNRVLETAFRRNPPSFFGGGNGNVKYGVQVGQSPPRFAVYVNNTAFFDRNYIRYLNNQIRAAFPFPGTVLRIDLRATERPKKGGRAPKLPEDVAKALAQKSKPPGKSHRPEISNPPEVLE